MLATITPNRAREEAGAWDSSPVERFLTGAVQYESEPKAFRQIFRQAFPQLFYQAFSVAVRRTLPDAK